MTRPDELARTWHGLAAELDDDRDAVHRFVTTWAHELDGRLRRARAALAAGDVADAEAALLSVRCTSAMAGAHEVAALAALALDALRDRHDGDAAAAHLPALGDAAARARAAATAALAVWPAEAGPAQAPSKR